MFRCAGMWRWIQPTGACTGVPHPTPITAAGAFRKGAAGGQAFRVTSLSSSQGRTGPCDARARRYRPVRASCDRQMPQAEPKLPRYRRRRRLCGAGRSTKARTSSLIIGCPSTEISGSAVRAMMPVPVTRPAQGKSRGHHRTGQIDPCRGDAPCPGPVAPRAAGRDASQRGAGDEDMTLPAEPGRTAQQPYKIIPRRFGAPAGAGLVGSAGAVDFARGDARETQPRPFRAPDRAVAVPDPDRCTAESLAQGDDGRQKQHANGAVRRCRPQAGRSGSRSGTKWQRPPAPRQKAARQPALPHIWRRQRHIGRPAPARRPKAPTLLSPRARD